MIYKPIIIVAGEPNSIFLEIFFKTITYKKFKSPIILIASLNLIFGIWYILKIGTLWNGFPKIQAKITFIKKVI